MSSTSGGISTETIVVGQRCSDGFTFYVVDKSEDQNNETKSKLADLYDYLLFMVKRSQRDPDTELLFPEKRYNITDPDQEDITVSITPDDTNQEAGKYHWEIKGFRPDEDTAQPIMMGEFIIAETVIDEGPEEL